MADSDAFRDYMAFLNIDSAMENAIGCSPVGASFYWLQTPLPT